MMKRVLPIVALAIALALFLRTAMVVQDTALPHGVRKGIPISDIADGKVAPQVGLARPLPSWLPLPEKGAVIGADVLPPQPPYGASATIMLKLDETESVFVAAYRERLAQSGFALRSVSVGFNLIIDKPDAVYEADEQNRGGHVLYVVLRAWQFAQITAWNPPSPRMPDDVLARTR